MKPLHVAVLVIGAVLAGGLAVEMTQPPPLPAPVSTPVSAAPASPVQAPVAAPPPPVLLPDKARLRPPPQTRTAAPPPVYAPTPRVEEPSARRKPFAPVAIAKVNPPPLKPAPYEEPPHVSKPEPVTPEPVITKPEPPARPRRQVVLQPGMQIAVRLNQALSSDRAAAGDALPASLAEPIVVDGLVIAERGAHVTVHVIDSQRTPNGIQLGLSDVQTADGQRIAMPSEPWARRETRAGDIMGTILDALGGTGKDESKPVSVPARTVIRFHLISKVTITERQL